MVAEKMAQFGKHRRNPHHSLIPSDVPERLLLAVFMLKMMDFILKMTDVIINNDEIVRRRWKRCAGCGRSWRIAGGNGRSDDCGEDEGALEISGETREWSGGGRGTGGDGGGGGDGAAVRVRGGAVAVAVVYGAERGGDGRRGGALGQGPVRVAAGGGEREPSRSKRRGGAEEELAGSHARAKWWVSLARISK